MPEIVGANTNVPAIAIGERASSFILDENERRTKSWPLLAEFYYYSIKKYLNTRIKGQADSDCSK